MNRSAARWRKSSRSQVGGNECVEVGEAERAVLIRDSKDSGGQPHIITQAAFRELVGRIKSGGLDL